ncbi:MAG: exodeoxyribonuclease VII small subunit [Planctomycetes bacterium]|nr:exodeoxyribonuclease VII small subunit [Planctomycetota bacterium]
MAKDASRKSPVTAEDLPLSYEQAMERLEALVRRMEQGEVPLEESLKAFEEGQKLVARCRGILDDAERRIQQMGLERLVQGEGG